MEFSLRPLGFLKFLQNKYYQAVNKKKKNHDCCLVKTP